MYKIIITRNGVSKTLTTDSNYNNVDFSNNKSLAERCFRNLCVSSQNSQIRHNILFLFGDEARSINNSAEDDFQSERMKKLISNNEFNYLDAQICEGIVNFCSR